MALPVRAERGLQFDPFDVVRNDLNMLGRFLGFSDAGDGGNPLAALSNYGVDIREDADHIYVEADLPGFRKEDIDISLENGMLTITAERQEEITEPPPGQGGEQQDQAAQPGQGQQADQGQRRGGGGGRSQQQQQQTQQRQQDANYLLRERRVQRFVRSFTLPPNVDESSVQARLENGVLRITLNKREESKAKRIEVS
jgi:HSP20 family protein